MAPRPTSGMLAIARGRRTSGLASSRARSGRQALPAGSNTAPRPKPRTARVHGGRPPLRTKRLIDTPAAPSGAHDIHRVHAPQASSGLRSDPTWRVADSNTHAARECRRGPPTAGRAVSERRDMESRAAESESTGLAASLRTVLDAKTRRTPSLCAQATCPDDRCVGDRPRSRYLRSRDLVDPPPPQSDGRSLSTPVSRPRYASVVRPRPIRQVSQTLWKSVRIADRAHDDAASYPVTVIGSRDGSAVEYLYEFPASVCCFFFRIKCG